MIYGIKDPLGDLTITIDGTTYACNLDPVKAAKMNNANLEDCPIWQIARVAVTQDPQTLEARTRIQYPNGSMDYNFCPNSINQYVFKYRL